MVKAVKIISGHDLSQVKQVDVSEIKPQPAPKMTEKEKHEQSKSSHSAHQKHHQHTKQSPEAKAQHKQEMQYQNISKAESGREFTSYNQEQGIYTPVETEQDASYVQATAYQPTTDLPHTGLDEGAETTGVLVVMVGIAYMSVLLTRRAASILREE